MFLHDSYRKLTINKVITDASRMWEKYEDIFIANNSKI